MDSRRILEAAQQNNTTAVKQLFKINKNIRSETISVLGEKLAEIAASKGNLNMLKYVLKEMPKLLKDRKLKNSTLLRSTIAGSFLDVVKYLVDECKAEILAAHCPTSGDTYVHLAAELGRLEIIKYFIEEQKVNVNLKNELGQPLVFAAARGARLNIIKYLVEERKADTTVSDTLKRNILSYSAQKGDLKVPIYLLDKKQLNIAINNTLVVHDAIAHAYKLRASKRINFIKYFVEEKAIDVNGRDTGGKTPIHVAARDGTLGIVKYLIHHGSDIHAKTNRGQTPLHLAAGEGKLNIVHYLIQNGANIQIKDSEGKTPLHIAVSEGKLSVVSYLVRKGASMLSQDSKGRIPAQLASKENVIKYLQREGKRNRRSLLVPLSPTSFSTDLPVHKWKSRMITKIPNSLLDVQISPLVINSDWLGSISHSRILAPK